MTGEIIALAVRPDGSSLVAVWPTRTCRGCEREAALGVIRLRRAEPRRNEFWCVECDEFDAGARLLPDAQGESGSSTSCERDNGGLRAASSHQGETR